MNSIFSDRKIADRFARYLGANMWDVGDAAKLTVCGETNCIHFEPTYGDIEPCDAHWTGKGPCNDAAVSGRVREVLDILVYANNNTLDPVVPQDYIQWALSKAITLPQAMLDWYNLQSHPVAPTAAAATSLPTLNIPTTRWSGRTPEMAYNELKCDYGPEAIAVVLEKLSNNKTENGRLLSPQSEKDNGVVRDPVTYQRRFAKYLRQGKEMYSFTFDG